MIDSILIVEDNDADAELMSLALNPHCGYVRRVRSLSEGVNEVGLNEPDVVLLDVGGIGADSPHHAIAEIKNVRHKAAIVVISGNSDPAAIDQGIMATASGWIVKGRWENLLHEVRSAYRNHRSIMEVRALKSTALTSNP